MIGSTPTRGTESMHSRARFRDARAALFSTGCKAWSLYDDDAFGTPNGLALAYVSGVNVVSSVFVQGYENAGDRLIATLLNLKDPYGGMMQSRDLREIASFQDTIYRAKSDLLELNLEADLGENHMVYSQQERNWEGVYSCQDINRYNTQLE